MSWQKKINKENILEEYKKRFSQILEYTLPNSDIIGEDDETPEGKDEMPKGDNNQDIPTNTDAPMDNNDMGDEVEAPMGEEMPMDMNASMGDEQDLTAGFNPQGDNMDDNTSMMQPDDEVVDITELTDAQEETQEELEQVDAKFVKAINAIQSLHKALDANNKKIENLESELKKRNPTPMEKMSNRAAISYPFNVSPEEYWEEKEKTSNYRTDDDNNGKEEEYTITVGDVNNSTDWKGISDSMDDDFLYNQTLEKLLKM